MDNADDNDGAIAAGIISIILLVMAITSIIIVVCILRYVYKQNVCIDMHVHLQWSKYLCTYFEIILPESTVLGNKKVSTSIH